MMNGAIHYENSCFYIQGDLNFFNVMSLYEKSLPQLAKCPEFKFDFSKLTSTDSAGLSLIIEWIKLSQREGKKIQFVNLSDEIMDLAKAAGINELISVPR